MLANLVCVALDADLQGIAIREGITYTRYADDITFSGEMCKRRSKNVPLKRPDGPVVAVRKCTALKSSEESEVLWDFSAEEADGGCLRWRCMNAFDGPATSRG